MAEVKLRVVTANPIREDSWLNESEMAWFRHAYQYAAQSHQSIPALAVLTPEEAYYLLQDLLDGVADRTAPLMAAEFRRVFENMKTPAQEHPP